MSDHMESTTIVPDTPDISTLSLEPSDITPLPAGISPTQLSNTISAELTLNHTEYNSLIDYSTLESQFGDILNNITNDQTLKKFKSEYEKLHTWLKKSHLNEKYLISKIRDLTSELLINSHAIHSAVKLTTNDTHTINILKKEITQAWTIITKNDEKEQYFKSIIEKLKSEISLLSTLVERGTNESIGNDNLTNELLDKLKRADELNIELQSTITQQNNKIDELQSSVQQQSTVVEEYKTNESQLNSTINTLTSDLQREQKNNDRYNTEIVNIKNINTNIKSMLHTKNEHMEQLLNKYNETDGKLKNQNLLCDKQLNQISVLQNQIGELEKNLLLYQSIEQNLLAERTESLEKNMILKRDINIEKNNYLLLHKKYQRLNKLYDTQLVENDNFIQYKQYIKSQLNTILNNLKSYKIDITRDSKLIDTLKRDNQSQNVQLLELYDKLNKQQSVIQQYTILQNENKTLQHTLHAVQDESYEKLQQVEKLNTKNIQRLNQSVNAEKSIHNEKLQLSSRIRELLHELSAERNKYSIQYQLYESMKQDRNMMEKKYYTLNDLYIELQQKYDIVEYQNQQVLYDNKQKLSQLQTEYYQSKLLNDEIKLYQKKLLSQKKVLDRCDAVLITQNTEIQHLRHVLHDIDTLQSNQLNTLNHTIKQRDLLAQQVIQRNDTIELLNEKIQLLKSILSSGETLYNDKINEIKKLNLQLMESHTINDTLKNQSIYYNRLKHEIYTLEKKYLYEKQKNSLLLAELDNPLNIHRYRLLENTTPDQYSMVQKLMILQKRLIRKTEQYIESNQLNTVLNNTIQQLKSTLKSHTLNSNSDDTGMDTLNQLVKHKNKQIKILSSELNMYHVNEAEHKHNIQQLNHTINTLKKQLYSKSQSINTRSSHNTSKQSSCRIIDITNESEHNSDLNVTACPPLTTTKVLGGGFNLNNTMKSPRSKKTTNNENKENSGIQLNSS